MRKMLLAAVVGLTTTSLMGQTAPAGVGTPVIWFKADAESVTADATTHAVSAWKNSGSLNLTLSVAGGADAPTYTENADHVNFTGNAHLADSTADNNLWSALNTHTFETFIVSQASASGAFIYLGGQKAAFAAGADESTRDTIHNISYGSRGVYFTGPGDADGEAGFYGNGAAKPYPNYLPNVPNGQSGASGNVYITDIGAQPPYLDPNSLLFSLNGTANIGGGVNYRGQGPDYKTAGANFVIAPQVSYISLNGRKTADGTWTRNKPGDYYEVIIYDRVLTTEERQKVLSYLALKYNVYLSLNLAHNDLTATGETVTNGSFYASDDEQVYARDAFGTDGVDSFYTPSNHYVAWIGRDDNYGFAKTGDYVFNTYIETNGKVKPSGDLTYMTMTANHGAVDASTDLVANPVPQGANILARSAKIWKITTLNFTDGFNFVPAIGSSYGKTSASADSILLLVSPTPAFATGETKGYRLQGRTFTGSGFAYWDNISGSKIFGTSTQPTTLYFAVALLNGTTSALPVGLSNFTAKLMNGSVELGWHSNIENGVHYTVQRSVNGQWQDLAIVAGEGDNHDYSYSDPNPVPGVTNLYRIEETDPTGQASYSAVRYVDLKNNHVLVDLKAYPNPTSGKVQLVSETSIIEPAKVVVYNVSGQLLRVPVSSGGNKVTVDLSSQASGIYFIRSAGNVVKVLKY